MKAMRFPTFDADLHESLVPRDEYVRYAATGLAIQRILDDGIEGAFAECGVFRGVMSRVIRDFAPERPLFLMDTFEGFPVDELEPGTSLVPTEPTPLSEIRETVGPGPIILKGRVTDRFIDIEAETFAFVLLDLDTYKPTLASLHFFWPRMSGGGFLFVHDYNNTESNHGCKRAVDEFFTDQLWRIVEIPDQWGSALVRRGG